MDNFDNSRNSFLWPEYFIDFLCERWIPCQVVTSVLCLHYTAVHKMRTPLHYNLGIRYLRLCSFKLFIFICGFSVHFLFIRSNEETHRNKPFRDARYLPNFWSELGFKGTVVNWALTSQPGGLQRITLLQSLYSTVSLVLKTF